VVDGHIVTGFSVSNLTSSAGEGTISGQRVAYTRVSTLDQNTARQLDGTAVDTTFTDKASGKDVNRPQLATLLGFVREGDTAMANLLASVVGAFAAFEGALIGVRQREGITLAKQRGADRGRKKSLIEDQVDQVRQRPARGKRTAHLPASSASAAKRSTNTCASHPDRDRSLLCGPLSASQGEVRTDRRSGCRSVCREPFAECSLTPQSDGSRASSRVCMSKWGTVRGTMSGARRRLGRRTGVCPTG
jgi:Resolvase, N terminal domain